MIDGDVAAALTVRLNCLESLPAAFFAATVKIETPSAIGIPLITPVEDPKLSPVGRVPVVTLHVTGVVPITARVCE
jgi:hypothetical protein